LAPTVVAQGGVQQRPPTFRVGTTLVPVDVRVLDRDGRAVTDLTAADFVVKENGVEQKVVHFATHRLSSDAAFDAPVRRMTTATPSLEPQNRRVFLIVLGRGRLQEPSKAMDAVQQFVRERLMPQDQVAIMAWNRATEFTTDHARTAAVLERFRAAHEEIELELSLRLSGLAALYAERKMTQDLQARIDAVFEPALAPGTRQVLYGGQTGDAEALFRKQAFEQLAAEMRGGPSGVGSNPILGGSLFGAFDDYVAISRQTMLDVGNLYAAIEYLRFIDGEKHAIFLSENGIMMPAADGEVDVGRLASEARVAIHTVQTGGVQVAVVNGIPQPAFSGFALTGLRTVAETSGGEATASDYADRAFDRILRATEFTYVLGYSSSNPALDGRFRVIEIEVKRRNVTASYRRGYFARREAESFNPRRQLATTRLVTAAAYREDIKDIRVSLAARDIEGAPRPRVAVDVSVAADRLHFDSAAGQHKLALSVAIICADERWTSVGEAWRMAVDVTVPEPLLEGVKRDGLKLRFEVPVLKRPIFVKGLVYDYGADLVGMTYIRMR
jgi:VWFA-related protein